MTRRVTLAGFIALLAMASTALAGGTFEILTEFPGSYFGGSMNLSTNGQAAAGFWDAPYYWTAEGGIQIIPQTGLPAGAYVSGDGLSCITSETHPDTGYKSAAIWSPTEGYTHFLGGIEGYSEECDDNISSGFALDYTGETATGLAWVPNCRAEAYKWNETDGVVALGRTSDTISSRGTDISDDGSIVVGFDEHPDWGCRRPALWTDDVTGPQLFAGEEVCGEALGISPNGDNICGISDGSAYYYSEGTGLIDIGILSGDPWHLAYGNAVSDLGVVVGESGDNIWGPVDAFIWSQDLGLLYLSDYLTALGITGHENYVLWSARDISANGKVIVGLAVDPDLYLLVPFRVEIDDATPAMLSMFDYSVSPGAVDFSFEIHMDSASENLELVASKGQTSWTVDIEGAGIDFSARDEATELLQGGEVTYSLYYNEHERHLLHSETVDLGSSVLSTRLLAAHPNPFNPVTTVNFMVEKSQRVKINVVDVSGRMVTELGDGVYEAGQHSISWNGTDSNGETVASGVYFVHMASTEGVEMQKVVMLK